MYAEAAELETIYGLLVIKNGYLIAEDYWHGSGKSQKCMLASVTKSYTGALVGLALDQGCLSSPDQRMLEFFPELAGQIADSREEQITIKQMLQMRVGYPWEERDAALWEALWSGE